MAAPPEVDDEAVAEALRIFLEHERYSRTEAIRKVLIWARGYFLAYGMACGPYVHNAKPVVDGGGGGGTKEGIEDYERAQRSGTLGGASSYGSGGGVSPSGLWIYECAVGDMDEDTTVFTPPLEAGNDVSLRVVSGGGGGNLKISRP